MPPPELFGPGETRRLPAPGRHDKTHRWNRWALLVGDRTPPHSCPPSPERAASGVWGREQVLRTASGNGFSGERYPPAPFDSIGVSVGRNPYFFKGLR